MSAQAQPRTSRRSRLLRALGVVGAVMLTLMACAGFALLILIQNSTPPTVWQNPPLYAGAQEVRVADFAKLGIMETDGSGDGILIMKVITYTVQAPQTEVLSFYRRAFSMGGMTPSVWGGRFPAPKVLNYSWTGHTRSPSIYFLDLVTRVRRPSHTEVEIGVSMYPGE